MKYIKVEQYDAFSNKPNKGNPAGVVIENSGFTDEEMKEIARKVGFNETSFLEISKKADFRIRYFTPGHEMNLCGHATMATIYALSSKGLLGNKQELTIETNAGILPIKNAKEKQDTWITMQQASPQFKPFKGSKEDLANSLGIELTDISDELPIVYGSTGIWTLLIPIRTLHVFQNMKPQNQLFPDILKEMPKASIHPFCLETYDAEAHMHARHFSSPFSGTIEDSVTGTASGVMGAYYATYIGPNFHSSLHLLVEQGMEINRDGRVQVIVTRNNDKLDIEIKGNAVYVKEFEITI